MFFVERGLVRERVREGGGVRVRELLFGFGVKF
jgi:hypothetical protein